MLELLLCVAATVSITLHTNEVHPKHERNEHVTSKESCRTIRYYPHFASFVMCDEFHACRVMRG
jgi:hypothetical protein